MTGNINPDRTQFEAFKALPRDRPVNMLNLVRVKDVAVYPDGTETPGREAYGNYGRFSAPVLERVGGSILWRGSFETVLIGPSDERWDFCFIARYPTAGAFLAMVTDPEYQKAVVHRTAAVEDSRLIRMGEMPEGGGFSG